MKKFSGFTKGNLARTYQKHGRFEEALQMRRDVYSGFLKHVGEENINTMSTAINYASALHVLKRFKEAKELMRRMLPVARRTRGESHSLTLSMRWSYARALYQDPAATLDDLREAVATLEDMAPTARRVYGGGHPLASAIDDELQDTRAALRGV